MARRSKTSPFEDLIFIASRLPWWVSLLIAFAAWLFFHSVATSPAPTVANTKQLGEMMGGQMFRTFSMFLQYIIPAAFVIGAVASVIGRSKRRKLLSDAASAAQSAQVIDGMSWREFEQLVGEAFRRKGFTVTETGGNGPDGGIDLVLRIGSDKYLVQCKQWKAVKVGVTVIREFFGVMTASGAAGGFIVTSGSYTSDAISFAKGRNIELISGTQLKTWIKDYRAKVEPAAPAYKKSTNVESNPTCPICGSDMKLRIANRGSNLGGKFLGCSRYPNCKGTLNL